MRVTAGSAKSKTSATLSPKHALLGNVLWSMLVELGEESEWSEELSLSQPSELTKTLWLKRFEATSLETLSNSISSIKRWQKWSSLNKVKWHKPTPVQMAEYFRSVADGGPTAAWTQARS